MNALVQGVEVGMAAGEIPIKLITPNIQLTIESSLLTNIGNSIYAIPPTPSQTAYGAVQSEVILGPQGLSYCPKMGSYAQMAVLQWSTNPYAASRPVLSPLLRFSSVVQADSATVITDKTSYASASSSPDYSRYADASADSPSRTRDVLQTNNTYELPGNPAYLLLIQFSSPRNFNFSAAANYTSRGLMKARSNYSIPVCTQYDSVRAAYVPCQGCDISSYTNYNVTYSCYDISQICPSGEVRRRFKDADEHFNYHYDSEQEEGEREREDMQSDDDDDDGEGGRERSSGRGYSRALEAADDDNAEATSMSPATYGMLSQAVVAQLSSVLSSNPFASDLTQSKTVLVFVGCLTGFIGLVLIFLSRKDRTEKMEKKYLRSQTNIRARKLLEQDIKQGKKGDRGVLYHSYLSQFKRDVKKDSSWVTWVAHTARCGYLHAFKRTVCVRKVVHKQTVFPSVDNEQELNKDDDDEEEYNTDNKGDGTDEINDTDHHNNNTNSNSNSNSSEKMEMFKSYRSEAVFTEFMHKLFPGHAIFSKKTSALFIIAVNHDYLKMFGGSTMTHSRTVRFIELVSVVLVSLFVDTVFFGVFYSPASCTQFDTKVSTTLCYIGVLVFTFA
jgi:Chromatin assembly factor 1 subunit A